jgi:hypothetical protein
MSWADFGGWVTYLREFKNVITLPVWRGARDMRDGKNNWLGEE